MLEILQYLSLICSFLLPFLTGALVTCSKKKDTKRTAVCVLSIAVCLIIVGVTVTIAFGISE